MIPTIQIVYGSMPQIDYEEQHIEYDRDFYLFRSLYDVEIFGEIVEYKIINEEDLDIIDNFFNDYFKLEDFRLSFSNHYCFYIYSWNDLATQSELNEVYSYIINTFITDEFYDAFQLFVSQFKIDRRKHLQEELD
jgi:hypothetical protein